MVNQLKKTILTDLYFNFNLNYENRFKFYDSLTYILFKVLVSHFLIQFLLLQYLRQNYFDRKKSFT